jgi:hypothetical protein
MLPKVRPPRGGSGYPTNGTKISRETGRGGIIMRIKINNQVLVVSGTGANVSLDWEPMSTGWDTEFWGAGTVLQLPDGNMITSVSTSLNGDSVHVICFIIPNQRFVDWDNFKEFGREIIPLAVQVESSVCDIANKFEFIDI